MMVLKLFTQLRPSFIIGFVVLWNILCLGGMQLNGGSGPIKTLPATALFFLAAALAATAGFGPLLSPRLRSLTLKNGVDLAQTRPGLILFGVIGSFLMLGAVVNAAIIAFGAGAA